MMSSDFALMILVLKTEAAKDLTEWRVIIRLRSLALGSLFVTEFETIVIKCSSVHRVIGWQFLKSFVLPHL